MCFDCHGSGVHHLRLFFTGEQEALAVSLAKLFLEHLDDSDYFVRPDDPIEELIGWGTKPVPEIVSFLKTMEEQEVFPKEALAHVETFRELVEYVAARSHSCHPTAHNSFTNL